MKWICLIFLCPFFITAQEQIVNGSFEDWGHYDADANGETIDLYEVPGGNWATNNKISLIGAPIGVLKDSEFVVDGSYSVKIVSSLFGTLPAAGFVGYGEFEVNLQDPRSSLREGKPFTSRPDNFQGYYLYQPVDGDTCHIYAILTKFSDGKRDTIARAHLVDSDSYSEFQFFDVPLEYYSEQSPDSAIVLMTSSKNGDNFDNIMVGNGSTLYVDALSFYYSTSSVDAFEDGFSIFPNPANSWLKLQNKGNKPVSSILIYNVLGELVFEQRNATSDRININALSSGLYFLQMKTTTSEILNSQFQVIR